MEQGTKVHRWSTKNEYYNVEDGTELRGADAKMNYDIIRKYKTIKIENYHGYITITNECERKRQTKLW